MFFRLGFHTRSKVEQLLERDDVTLDEVLDEDDVLQEAKAHNSKLIEFLMQKENLVKLIEYITVEPPAEKELAPTTPDDATSDDENDTLTKRIHKFPHVAADILASDLDTLYSVIVNDSELLDALFAFINSANITLATHWIRSVTSILQRKPVEVTKYVLSHDKSFVNNIVNMIGLPAMDELVLKLMGCESLDNTEGSSPFSPSTQSLFSNQLKLKIFEMQNKKKDKKEGVYDVEEIAKWWLSHDITASLIAKLDPQYDSEVHTSVTKVLSQIVKRSLPSIATDQLHPLAISVLSQTVLENLVDKLLQTPNTSIVINGISLLSVLLETSVEIIEKNKIPNLWNEERLSPVVKVVLSRLPKFVQLLANPPSTDTITTSTGALDPPLGETRLQVIEFLSSLFHIQEAEEDIVKSNVLIVILDLFFKYEFNNLLHNLVTKVVTFILTNDGNLMKRSLFVDAKICERIVQANKLNEQAITKPKGMRKGYMGHLTTISNTIVSTTKSNSELLDIVKDDASWKEYVDGTLTLNNHLNNQQIGGPNPIGNLFEDLEKQLQGFDDEMDDDNQDRHEIGATSNAYEAPTSVIMVGGNDDSDDDSDEDDEMADNYVSSQGNSTKPPETQPEKQNNGDAQHTTAATNDTISALSDDLKDVPLKSDSDLEMQPPQNGNSDDQKRPDDELSKKFNDISVSMPVEATD